MVQFRPGSHVLKIVTLLSFLGELPFQTLHLLGSERVYKALIVRLTKPEQFINTQTGEEMTCRLFTLTGSGQSKTVRLYKKALHILEWVHPDAYRYYMEAFWEHHFPGDSQHLDRHHRVAEAAIMCMRAGFTICPYLLPELQNQRRAVVVPQEPVLYLGRALKGIGGNEANKTNFTRLTGAVFVGGAAYAVYNTRSAVMKWRGKGEFKALQSLSDISRLNAAIEHVDSAVLFGNAANIALETAIDTTNSHRREFRFDSIYSSVHFIPMDENDIRQLRLLTAPNWKERLLSLLFDPETRSYGRGMFEHDACVDGTCVLSYLDGDLARLIRFKEGTEGRTEPLEVLCFPHQVGFLREYLEGRAVIKTIEMDAVEAALEIEGRDALE